MISLSNLNNRLSPEICLHKHFSGLFFGALIGNNTIGNGISTAAVSMGTLWMFWMMRGTFQTQH